MTSTNIKIFNETIRNKINLKVEKKTNIGKPVAYSGNSTSPLACATSNSSL